MPLLYPAILVYYIKVAKYTSFLLSQTYVKDSGNKLKAFIFQDFLLYS